jgi:AcrR family transcriptional regulator
MNRTDILSKALTAFLRYGYRKASMGEIALEVGVSRQALHARFGTKAELFEETVRHLHTESLRQAREALEDTSAVLSERIFTALDSWAGRFVEPLRASPHAAEIIHVANAEMAEMASDAYESLQVLLVAALREAVGVAAEDVAFTLLVAAKGLVHIASSREEFRERIRVVVRVALLSSSGGEGRP